jgi:hypothetical protein
MSGAIPLRPLYASMAEQGKLHLLHFTFTITTTSTVRFPMVSLEFFSDIILPAAL